jgi:two-component system LytT family response regulator
MRVIIVDDEPLARDRLRALLSKESDVQIVAECGDGREAVTSIKRENPDVVFLDIQMPELDGFGVLAQLKGGKMPQVVFVTAFDEFAVKAFEVHALDYLLKPFDKERLKSAVSRARDLLKTPDQTALTEKLSALLDTLNQQQQQPAAAAGAAAAGAAPRAHRGETGRTRHIRPARRHRLDRGPGQLREAARGPRGASGPRHPFQLRESFGHEAVHPDCPIHHREHRPGA